MDLIGEFHPPSSKGNRYALTAVCMLTGYTFCIPIMDNGTEFKNDLFSRVAEQLGVERKTYSPLYRTQSMVNSRDSINVSRVA